MTLLYNCHSDRSAAGAKWRNLAFHYNLSPLLVRELHDVYPDCVHVRDFDLHRADDFMIWEFAIENDFIIVSKDSDFHQLALLMGPPPKVVWIRRGNCSTKVITDLLRNAEDGIVQFASDPVTAFMVLE